MGAPQQPRLRPAHWLALVVALVGIAVSLAPSARTSVVAACPYLTNSSAAGAASPHSLVRALLAHALPRGWLAAPRVGGTNAPATYTRTQLRAYDGTCGGASPPAAPAAGGDATATLHPACRVLLGVAGDVFDVTELGAQFYAPGAGYSMFAARDSTRALALGSLAPRDVHSWLIDHFTPEQRAAVKEQHEFYSGKYGPRVGVLVEDPEGDAKLLAEGAAAVAAAEAMERGKAKG